jgi:hypothetical protein
MEKRALKPRIIGDTMFGKIHLTKDDFDPEFEKMLEMGINVEKDSVDEIIVADGGIKLSDIRLVYDTLIEVNGEKVDVMSITDITGGNCYFYMTVQEYEDLLKQNVETRVKRLDFQETTV